MSSETIHGKVEYKGTGENVNMRGEYTGPIKIRDSGYVELVERGLILPQHKIEGIHIQPPNEDNRVHRSRQ